MIKFKKLKYWRTEKTAPESAKTRVLRRRREGCSRLLLQNLERGGTVILTGKRPSTVGEDGLRFG